VGALRVVFVQVSGAERVIEDAQPGQSLMSIARANGVPGILGDCGGCCSCATCHVYVEPEWQAAVGGTSPEEDSALEGAAADVLANSRLCCQIAMRPELDGIRVKVAPGL
jgi:ferredoxin, 2Fe-2S